MKTFKACAACAALSLSVISLLALQSCASDKSSSTTPAATCTSAATLTGDWTQPIPGQEGRQGFRLQEDGSAQSINMSTLQYSAWEAKGDTLLLHGKSVGNGQTIDFTDTLQIQQLTADSLIVARGAWVGAYSREK